MERVRPKAPWICKWIFVFVLITLYIPILTMILNSFSDEGGSTLKWYLAVFQDSDLIDSLVRSVVVATSNAVISVVLGFMASIVLLKTNFRFRKILNSSATLSLTIPELVFALALLTWFFLLKVPLGIFTIIIAHVTFSISFVILILNSRLSGMDPLIEDVARDLGAGEMKILFSIILPILMPAVVASLLLGFLLSFDDFLITFYTSGAGSDTLPIKLYSSMRFGLTPKLSALSTLMFFITLILSIVLVKKNSVIKF